MLLSGHKLELTSGNTSLKPGANFRVRCFTHTASQSIAVKLAFVEGIVLFDMRTTATSTSAVNERANA